MMPAVLLDATLFAKILLDFADATLMLYACFSVFFAAMFSPGAPAPYDARARRCF